MVATSALLTANQTPLQPAEGRWLSVVTHLDRRYGGLSSVVPQLSEAIASSGRFGMEVAAFCEADESCSPSPASATKATILPCDRFVWMRDSSLRQRFDSLLDHVSGVHVHGLWEQSTFLAARGARRHKLPYVLSAHGMLEPWALRQKRVKKALYSAAIERSNVNRASCLHALTDAEAADYRRYGARAPIAIVPNGVQVPEQLSSEIFLAEHPELRTKRIVLFLGRLHFKKGLDLLLQAWETITLRHDDAHLVLAGPDSEGTQIELSKRIEQAGIGENVTFAGMLGEQQKWSALAAAEAFVLPSYSEGLSVSTLEAMGAGLPVIISARCNLPQVEQIAAGWVIDTTSKALEEALDELLGHSPKTNRWIGDRGADYVRKHYEWTSVAARIAEVYAWVQGGPAPSSVEILSLGGGR